MKIVVDLSSKLWTCLYAGTDPEAYRVMYDGAEATIRTAGHGYEFVINSIKATLDNFKCTPIDLVLVKEGMNSKYPRVAIYKEYKQGRDNRAPEQYVEFDKLRAMVISAFGNLGALTITQDNVEGDDVLAWFADNTREDIVIDTNDGDMCALSGTNAHGAKITTYIGTETDVNKYGLFPTKYITLYKSMVGDSTDKIKGIPGFGEKAWMQFHARFGEDGMQLMVDLAEKADLSELEEDAENDAFIKKIYDNRAEFIRSYKVAKLHPEWVQTMQNAVVFQPGMVGTLEVKDERLRHWQARRRLVTADNWDEFLPWFLQQIMHRPYLALDIETSTPDESDEWLAAQGDPDGVDVIGSELTGMSLTFGDNMQFTVYISVDHVDTNNVPKEKILELLKAVVERKRTFVIQNVSFEGTVLYNEFGHQWLNNGAEGFLPNMIDTKLMASYVDENDSTGLKKLSKKWLNYDQVEYTTVTTIEGVRYKMRELSAKHVFDYACDDTVCTAAFYNFGYTFIQLEGAWQTFLDVEVDSSYTHTQSFVHGVKLDVAKLKHLEAEDIAEAEVQQRIVDEYLIANGWEGTVVPVYTEFSPAAMKESHLIVTGTELDTKVRLPAKMLAAVDQTQTLFIGCWQKALEGDFTELNQLVAQNFSGKPVFSSDSPKQMCKLLYETMGLPVRVYNKPTPAMKAAGQRQGNPKADALAVAYAIMDSTPELKAVLEALRIVTMIATRKELYYTPYPYFVHWKTGRVHSSHNQSATNTRRASSSKPNLQQQSKHEKLDGYAPRVREVIIPHRRDAVIVSMDFMSQELRVIAEYSQDPNMVACYVGDHLKDMHAFTGLGIYNYRQPLALITYEEFEAILGDKKHPLHKVVKECRSLGKKTNFTTEYGAQPPKLAATLMVPLEDAVAFLEAREKAFHVAAAWKQSVIAEAKRLGYVTTMLGARRHLREALLSDDWFTATKAERQAVNFKIQSSSAEMTKLSEGRMWKARLEQTFDCEIIAPVHDEVVASVVIDELIPFCKAMHGCMAQKYANMSIPVMSSISAGPSFGEQTELGEFVDDEVFTNFINQFKEKESA